MRITVHPAIQLNHLSIPAIHHSLICLIFCLLLGWTGFAEAGLDFAAVPGNTTGLHPESVAAADLNGDGKPELVTANGASHTVSVLLNTSTEGPSPVLGPIAPFGEQTVGTASSARAVTLSNTGTAAFELQSVTASGGFAVSHDCGGSLAPGASCTLQVTFTPTGPGVRSGSLAVAGTAGSPLTVPLSGTGVGPAYSVTADLFLKIAARKSVKQGKILAYSFVVKNRSKTRVPGVLVQGTLAEGAVYKKVPAFCGVSGQVLTCHLNALKGKGKKQFSVKVKPESAGRLVFQAKVSGEANDSNFANNTVEVATTAR